MLKLSLALRRLLRQEDGPTAVEYAVMLSLIIALCMAGVRTIGTAASATFTKIGASLGAGSSGGSGNGNSGNGNGNGGNGNNGNGQGGGNNGNGQGNGS